MSTQITVKVREVYGNQVIYPVCEKAQIFASLAGTKTLTTQALKAIKALGYTIVVEQQQLQVAA